MPTTLHLRSETKPLEQRSAITPKVAKILIDHGFTINVEHSPVRIFQDSEFEDVTFVPEGSYLNAPKDHLIIGLKELPDKDKFPLKHTHITFLHVFKGQDGWERVLSRFQRGGGTLYDLEFLQDANGRRVAAFGYHAGYSGAALALLNWARQILDGKPLESVSSFPNQDELVKAVREAVEKAQQKNAAMPPRVLVIGALGRCGSGAVDLCQAVGLSSDEILKWDMEETKGGGPFKEIIESDIFVNCIYLTQPIPPFVTKESLSSPSRKLSVVCDVSCDPNNPHNPVPIYDDWTTFGKLTLPVEVERDPPLTVIAIDHLPSLLPREASDAFSQALLPSLLELDKRDEAPVWVRAKELFEKKIGELPK